MQQKCLKKTNFARPDDNAHINESLPEYEKAVADLYDWLDRHGQRSNAKVRSKLRSIR